MVAWSHVTDLGNASSDQNFEAIFYEGSNHIDFACGSMAGAFSRAVGLESPSGSRYLRGCPDGTSTVCNVPTGTVVRFGYVA